MASRAHPERSPNAALRRRRVSADLNPSGLRHAIPSLTALGVVYGGIGTSPLYAFRACFGPEYGLPRTPPPYTVSSRSSALILIVSVKYMLVITRLDNRGEDGILVMLALLAEPSRDPVGVAVLSAAEGREIASPAFKPYVLPVTLLGLSLLFLGQRHGTARVGGAYP